MSFQELAHGTENVANKLSRFVSHVPEHAAVITSTISELYAISASLRSLESSHNVPALRPNFNRIIDDVELIVRASLRHTVRDILGSMEQMSGGGRVAPDQATYRATWMTLWSFFHQQAGFTLVLRLRYYRAMLEEMAFIVRGDAADEFVLARHRATLTPLRLAQDRRFAEIASQRRWSTAPSPQLAYNHPHPHPPPPPPLHPRHASQPPSPQQAVPHHRSNMPLKSAMRKPRPNLEAHHEPMEMPSFERERPRPQSPYEGLSRPTSPDSSLDTFESLASASGTTTSSGSSGTAEDVEHWVLNAFSTPASKTNLTQPGRVTRCFSQHMHGAWSRLNHEYKKLFQLAFPGDTPMNLSFHLRESDHRTRVLCSTFISPSRTDHCTLPITSLTITRDGSSLRLCQRATHRKDEELWADLRFASMEGLVAFHCAFLALRGQDACHPVGKIRDGELDGELQIYGGQIVDDDYLHALRIYRDADSRAVRLVASIHEGQMKRVPVWNAFIHHQMRSRSWMRRMGPTTLHLEKLQRTVYTDSSAYMPDVTADGRHIMTFASKKDIEDFIWCINDLVKRSRPVYMH